MKLEEVELREVSLRLTSPFTTSFGSVQQRRILLVRARAGRGEGWGECAAEHAPEYSPETVDTAWLILRRFAVPAVLGLPLDGARSVPGRLDQIRGNPMAKAALEAAVWDLQARVEGRPLWRMLGGTDRPVPVGVSVGLQQDVAHLLTVVEAYLEEGYLRVKLKIAPGRDLEPVAAVRRRWPELALAVDANGAYSPDDAGHLAALDELGLIYLEQPLAFDDLDEHARLAGRLQTPICLDESIRHARDAALALRIGAASVINVKPGRVGGLTEAIAVHDAARAAEAPAWVGGMLESGIGRAFNVALATLPGFTLPGDISASFRYWERDLVDPPWTLENGHLLPPSKPGIGVAIDHEYLDRVTVRTEVIA